MAVSQLFSSSSALISLHSPTPNSTFSPDIYVTLNLNLKGFNWWPEVLKVGLRWNQFTGGFHFNAALEALPLADKESVKLKCNEAASL